jgi:hypothetical protein
MPGYWLLLIPGWCAFYTVIIISTVLPVEMSGYSACPAAAYFVQQQNRPGRRIIAALPVEMPGYSACPAAAHFIQ